MKQIVAFSGRNRVIYTEKFSELSGMYAQGAMHLLARIDRTTYGLAIGEWGAELGTRKYTVRRRFDIIGGRTNATLCVLGTYRPQERNVQG